MKKENRKMAQERRAAARKKEERRKNIRHRLLYILAGAWIMALALYFIMYLIMSTDASDSSSSAASTSSAAEASAGTGTLDTDTSLTVVNGDTVNIDYVGKIDGEEFDGGSTNGNGADLTIGSGSYIDDFEEQLIGVHVGDTVDVEVTFPSDYSVRALQNQDAVFTVTINGIYE